MAASVTAAEENDLKPSIAASGTMLKSIEILAVAGADRF